MRRRAGTKAVRVAGRLEDLPSAKYEIERMLSAEPGWRVSIDGVWVADLPQHQFTTSIEYGKLIFGLWNEEFAQSWRVKGFARQASGMRLDLTRKMGSEGVQLELNPAGSPHEEGEDTIGRRERHLLAVVRALASRFSPMTVESASIGRSSVPGLPSAYARVCFRSGARRFAAISVSDGEPDELVHRILAGAIIWTHHLTDSGFRPERCLIIVPEARSIQTARRMTALSAEARAKLELNEHNPPTGSLSPVRETDQGRLFDPASVRLSRPRGEIKNAGLELLKHKLPDGVSATRHPLTGTLHVTCKGLELARITDRGTRINRAVASAAGLPGGTPLPIIAASVASLRRAGTDKPWHPLYRLQAERWLEELIREDPTKIDPQLDPRYIYPQVPAHGNTGRGCIDLLGIRRDGRLAVLELKVAEDVELPIQGLDYWLRVEWHRKSGDFLRRGYFADAAVSPLPAVLYLVAPVFSFHRALETVARAIGPEVPVLRISLNQNWRSGVRALRRDRLNNPPHLTWSSP